MDDKTMIADLRLTRPDLAHARSTVAACEAAGFDAVLLHSEAAGFEATTLAAALAPGTGTIGLLVACSAGELEPYHLARFTASIDHLSHGRSGWFLTGDAAVPLDATAEYLDVVKGLWDSFDDEAFVHDRSSGVYWRLDRLHTLDHAGAHYSVAGPLNVARPPQGHPVLLTDIDELAGQVDCAVATAGRATSGRIVALPAAAPIPAWLDADVAGLLIPVLGPDDEVLAAVANQVEPSRASGATLRQRLGLGRPASTFAR